MEKTILLVDDEPDIRDVLSISLSDMGYQVYEAENGDEALRIFKDRQPSLVMTDIKMPGMDGIELLQKVKHENPETEVIMITGHGDMDLAIRSLKNEATDFITKPINVDALEIAVKRAKDKIITRQKLQEYTENLEKLVHEKTELQSHLASLGLMIGSISHGIKGLLTGLDGGVYILDSGFAKKNEVQIKEGWDVVKLTIERIRKMVMDILFYAKERDLQLERIDILNFVKEIAKELEPKMKHQKIEFIRNFNSNLGEFEVDGTYVHSALINIIENAIDACARDISKKFHKIVFDARQSNEHIVFDVFDDGIGMGKETQEKLFTPFFSSKGDKGTGLGLFISNAIIHQHCGEIIVKSTPGKETLFRIKLPRMLPISAKAIKGRAAVG
jgi:signal transduction histidine kinase